MDAKEESKFRELPKNWSCRDVLPSMAPRRIASGVDDRFYNPYKGRLITDEETSKVLRWKSRPLQFGHLVGWDYSEVDAGFVENDVDPSGMRAALSDLGDEIYDDEEKDEDYEEFTEGFVAVYCMLTVEYRFLAVSGFL